MRQDMRAIPSLQAGDDLLYLDRDLFDLTFGLKEVTPESAAQVQSLIRTLLELAGIAAYRLEEAGHSANLISGEILQLCFQKLPQENPMTKVKR